MDIVQASLKDKTCCTMPNGRDASMLKINFRGWDNGPLR
eukprot:CAMPEP_0173220286 /NCGR_PEP_ID=MMETSP1142-20121109/2078_1 /TAXON_ID=483371 /ORGANISM="non described non described, Strain CCMP2298" /LENGTH=38 /DNA_ID= /DNA_START= /DNA_END= /DNA_ORIENTATION=